MYSDADWAGDNRTSKSTTGAFIALVGKNTFAPISALCKGQTVVSHSSTESEIVALDTVLRLEGVPILWFLEQVIPYIGPYLPEVERHAGGKKGRPKAKAQATPNGQRNANAFKTWRSQHNSPEAVIDELHGTIEMIVMEDNEAVINIVRKGRSPALRHVQRTHRIVLDWTYDLIRQNDGIWLRYIGTKDQIADLMTKGFLNSTLWSHLCQLIGVVGVSCEGEAVALTFVSSIDLFSNFSAPPNRVCCALHRPHPSLARVAMASSSIVKIPECANTTADHMDPGLISVAAETLIAFGSIMSDPQYQLCVDAVVEDLRNTNTDCQRTWPSLHQQGKVKTEPGNPSTKVQATSEGVSTATVAKAQATPRISIILTKAQATSKPNLSAAKAQATLLSLTLAAKAQATLRRGQSKTG